MLTLWGRKSAFNVQKVLWLLLELGTKFEHREVGGKFGGLDDPAFLALNPHGRIPVLKDEKAVVWESHTILRYLAASYGSRAFWSEDPATRSIADRWMDWSQSTLQPSFMRLFWGYFRTPPEQRCQSAIESAQEECERHFMLLESQLKKSPFLGGHSFSLADIPAGTSLYRYSEMGLGVSIPPCVGAWYARLRERPAYQSSVMISFSDLRGRLEF